MIGTILGSEDDVQTIASDTPIVTKKMLEKHNLVAFDDKSEDAKKIELICSPIKFGQMGSESLSKLFETFLHPDINIELAYDTIISHFANHYWNKYFRQIVLMLSLTRMMPLFA